MKLLSIPLLLLAFFNANGTTRSVDTTYTLNLNPITNVMDTIDYKVVFFNDHCDTLEVRIYDSQCGNTGLSWCRSFTTFYERNENGQAKSFIQVEHRDPSDVLDIDSLQKEIYQYTSEGLPHITTKYTFDNFQSFKSTESRIYYNNGRIEKQENFLAYNQILFLAEVIEYYYGGAVKKDMIQTQYDQFGDTITKIKFAYSHDIKGRMDTTFISMYDFAKKRYYATGVDYNLYLPDSSNIVTISTDMDTNGLLKDSLEYSEIKFINGKLSHKTKRTKRPFSPWEVEESYIFYNSFGIDSSITHFKWNNDSNKYEQSQSFKYSYSQEQRKSIKSYQLIYGEPKSTRLEFFPQCSTTTGLSDKNGIDKSIIYPNPASNQLNLSGFDAFFGIKILNLNGNVVLEEKVLSEITTINLSSLSPGIYLVQGVSLQGVYINKKLLKL